MSKAYIEYRTLAEGTTLAFDIAQHLYTRQFIGKVLIVTEEPETLLLALYKQWAKLTRKLQNERFDSDDATRMISLSRHVARMQHVQFTAEAPSDRPQADVFLIASATLDDLLPSFCTMYVTCEAPHDLLGQVVECMPEDSLVIAY